MSTYFTRSKLMRISPEQLRTLLLTQPTEQKVAVVDVRDSDHIGGHIKASRHVPSSTLDYAVPELVRTLKGTEKVVFHCALSQERGPKSALKYIQERQRTLGFASVAEDAVWEDDGASKERDGTGAIKCQEVYVLDGGFSKWQQKYVQQSYPLAVFASL
jgi:rhodanese-related sulfurtransferase